jgi:hypothetical protein
LVDIANLVGSGHFTQEQALRWKRALFSAIDYGESDIAQVATGPGTQIEVAFAFQPIRVEAAPGINGADFKLSDHVKQTDDLASRYSEVIIASGDGHFVGTARDLLAAGVTVTVVTGVGALHGDYQHLKVKYIDLKQGWEIVS